MVTSCVNGLNDIKGLVNFDVFPSPATDFVSLNVGLQSAQNLEIGLFNSQGQLVLSDQMQGSLSYQQTFDVSNLPAGLYQIKLQNGNQYSTKAFVIN